ncbi:gephyrin-like molybdotransferase Glp [Aquamicrobium defluvii]|uniref:Molybdopterin molybdenumtransferase n=1 Tax=Aquamicrobium defluvii TaxID=69279 RepID=A0A011TFL2_9HYPH|nr:gephyrin-like molybdotransferase Glp [Aquamicrobium defluvii]EXL02692.1 molybdopterin biosynthesis protein MoeA [Aquamicrobium defluvii]EZQ13264.1 molybdopterin biosynthesis protein MoeA [Halopseudomonas bauzanensis]
MNASSALSDPFFCGCETGPEQDALLSVDEALRRTLALVEPVAQVEPVPLEKAHGRVLAQAIRSATSLPLFDNSAMDGYAIRLADLSGDGPWRLPLAGRVAAGDAGDTPVPVGAALRIFTGAAIPPGCDAVVIQELTRLEGDTVEIRRRPEPDENIRRAGEDLTYGSELLPAGRRIGPRAAALLASAGCGNVVVRRRVRITYFSTGSELRAPGTPLAPGQIWNANRYHLQGALDLPWVEATDMGSVPDQPDRLREALEEASRNADLVVSTGGVSVGDEDHMPAVLRAAGGTVEVMKVAIKPGKPLLIGRIGRALYLGLPGNPVSAFVTWHVIGARIAEALAGLAEGAPRRIIVRAGFDRVRQPGRCEFLPARLGSYDGHGTRVVEIATSEVSHRVALLAQADGLLLIPSETDRIQLGDMLEFLPFQDG